LIELLVGCEQFRESSLQELTVLLVRLLEYCIVIEKFLNLGEQRRLLVVVMGFDELEPG
jgi:hypothetical protein